MTPAVRATPGSRAGCRRGRPESSTVVPRMTMSPAIELAGRRIPEADVIGRVSWRVQDNQAQCRRRARDRRRPAATSPDSPGSGHFAAAHDGQRARARARRSRDRRARASRGRARAGARRAPARSRRHAPDRRRPRRSASARRRREARCCCPGRSAGSDCSPQSARSRRGAARFPQLGDGPVFHSFGRFGDRPRDAAEACPQTGRNCGKQARPLKTVSAAARTESRGR